MLKRLKLRNFKSWPEAEVKFGRITGLFGPNSSGKSSLMQFLLLLKQTKESTDRAATLDLNGRFVELGTPTDVIHGRTDDSQLRVAFTLGFDHPSELRIHDALQLGGEAIARSKEIVVRARLRIHGGSFQSRMLAYKVGDAEFALKRAEGSNTKFDLVARVPESDFSFVRTRGRPWKLSGPVKTYRFPTKLEPVFRTAASSPNLNRLSRRRSTSSITWGRCGRVRSVTISGRARAPPMSAREESVRSMRLSQLRKPARNGISGYANIAVRFLILSRIGYVGWILSTTFGSNRSRLRFGSSGR